MGITPTKFWEWLVVPWTLSVSGQGSSFDFFGPAVIGFLPFAFYLRHKSGLFLGWAILLAGYFGVGLILSREIRYLLPGVALLAVLSGLGAAYSMQINKGTLWAWEIWLSFCLNLFILLCWNINIIDRSYSPYAVLSGAESREKYRSYYHPGMNPFPPNNIFKDIASLPPSARVMFLGEETVFGCPRPFVYSNVYDKTPFVELANVSQSSNELFEKLKEKGITNILINLPESLRLKGYGLFPWNETGKKVAQEFFQDHTTIDVVREQGLVLLSIHDQLPLKTTWTKYGSNLGPCLNLPIEMIAK